MSEWKREETSGRPGLSFVMKTRLSNYVIVADPWGDDDSVVEFSVERGGCCSSGFDVEFDVPLDVLAEVLRYRGWKVEAP